MVLHTENDVIHPLARLFVKFDVGEMPLVEEEPAPANDAEAGTAPATADETVLQGEPAEDASSIALEASVSPTGAGAEDDALRMDESIKGFE